MTQHDQPDCFELIRTVNDFLESIEGKLHGSDKYGLQCAKHVLNIIAREIEGGADGSLQTADDIKKLCLGIREGKYDDNWPETLGRILDHVVEKVKISDPNHLRGT